ncbi:PucR family transcriptional regulator [Paenibacillus sp. N4]|nr:PucR family transcriptional regulator [Paenibacillus vietnamensis]
MVKTVLQLTVKDILNRPLFRKAEAFANEAALNRTVKWVHIMEVIQVGHLLNGHELILSTGIGWHDDEELSLSFVRQLIDSGASGLCIELGTYAKRPFGKMKELAMRESFPLIFFHEEVRYIDITQDLHAHFIHQHHRMVSELEALSAELNQLLLSGKGILPLLRLLHQTTGAQTAFFPHGAEAVFVPQLPRAKADQFFEQWIYGKMLETAQTKSSIAHRPILALDHLFADLLIHSGQELSEFQILALDRCATAIAQEMMRTKYMEERRRHKDDLWAIDWLNGKHSTKDIRAYLGAYKPNSKLTGAAVCLFEYPPADGGAAPVHDGSALIQKNMVARSIFEGEGLLLLPLTLQDEIVFIMIDQLGAATFKERVMRAVDRLRKTERHQEAALFSSVVGIGCYMAQLSNISESYLTAKETLAIQKDLGPLPSPFYSDLHLRKIIYALKKADALPALMDEYLGAIVNYDREKNGQLLLTLKIYLAHSGSKQDTAKALHIARQTLYHRLDKLAALLGDDYMEPDKRLAVELALCSYEYVHGTIK